MKPESIAEQLLYSTVRLEALDGSSGTGFFFNFSVNGKRVTILLTNKHVVNYDPNATMRFFLHLIDDNGETMEDNYQVEYSTKWIFHPEKDICFTYVIPLFVNIKMRTGKNVFFRACDEAMIYGSERLKELDVAESVSMIGYPTGLWDRLHNYPIFRHGFTASHPAYDFNENGIGLVDMACFPGSSGSPIFILDQNGYTNKKGTHYLGESRMIFLGVLFAGPTMNINGQITIVDIPTQQHAIAQSQTMINLGYYIKAYELLKFREIIKNDIDEDERRRSHEQNSH
jgi:V8-like Glu-specific endopeptidase